METGYTVMVDVEKTLYDNETPFLRYLNDFIEENHGEALLNDLKNPPEAVDPSVPVNSYLTGSELEFDSEDVQGWGYDGVYETFAELRDWKGNRQEKFMNGDGDGWPGFHEAVDIIWTGELPYQISLMEQDAPENFIRLREVKDVEEVVVGTSRGNFFSDYDVESAVETRLAQDFGVETGEVLFLEEKTGNADIYIDDNPDMDLGVDEEQIAIRTPYNEHLPDENLVESFSEAVDLVDGKTAR